MSFNSMCKVLYSPDRSIQVGYDSVNRAKMMVKSYRCYNLQVEYQSDSTSMYVADALRGTFHQIVNMEAAILFHH